MTWREIVYMCLDEVKAASDDSYYNEDHVMFLISKYRAFILKQRYGDIRKQIPNSNYQTICLDLKEVPAICGEPCEGGSYLRSTTKIPFTMQIGTSRVYPIDYYQGEITLISRDRMRYVGHNRFLQNIIYCSIAPDNYLYFKSNNPQFLYLEKVKFTAIFQNPLEAAKLQCAYEKGEITCDVLDTEFPLEENLVPPVIELVVKDLGVDVARPEDTDNNSKDDLPDSYGRQG